MIMPVTYPTEIKLTGRMRFRIGWRGKMIAQVQESYQLRHFWQTKDNIYYRWRDATFYDVQSLNPSLVKDCE